MTGERYVLLGLAKARAGWFSDVSRWATSGALPAEFIKALSAEEVSARLRAGRRFSALVVDASVGGWDRDLIELAVAQGCAVVVVDDHSPHRAWHELGADAVLAADFGRDLLLETLRGVAQTVARADEAEPIGRTGSPTPAPWRGRLVALTGAGGVGRSTLAMALADGLATDPRNRGSVLLADMALDAQQGLLHDAGDIVPGLSELVEAHRRTALPVSEVRRLCFVLMDRGYDLLLGLRRHHDWTALRPHAVAAAVAGLQAAYRIVVAEVDADVEGETETGSIDIEERNQLARSCVTHADLVVVVGHGGMSGLHSQIRVLGDMIRLGVPTERILPVVNRAPRSPRRRSEIGAAMSELLSDTAPGAVLSAGPVYVPERRRLDDLIADNGRAPVSLADAMTSAVKVLLERTDDRRAGSLVSSYGGPAGEHPVPVAPGSLGSWSETEGQQTP